MLLAFSGPSRGKMWAFEKAEVYYYNTDQLYDLDKFGGPDYKAKRATYSPPGLSLTMSGIDWQHGLLLLYDY